MFEVEKKVILTKSQLEKIQAKADLLEKQEIKDVYFDDHVYTLTRSNKWLRKRQNQFELKVGLRRNYVINHYQEIMDEKEIKKVLEIYSPLQLGDLLPDLKIFPFCSFVTYRQKYRLGEIIVDLDLADFGELTYQIAEFELVVSSKNKMEQAEKTIEEKLKELGMGSNEPVLAKLSYFLMKKRYSHYEALKKEKVIS